MSGACGPRRCYDGGVTDVIPIADPSCTGCTALRELVAKQAQHVASLEAQLREQQTQLVAQQAAHLTTLKAVQEELASVGYYPGPGHAVSMRII